ncbi:MAG: TadE/TadG family type IV pilus assembly protein [Allosphingosinicella sp.]|uniref:TadE/TadG family type IV pilus assembly protein n=1 Tax=Allosphingosinicella sp. TaxID=2823234 RepID=UPI0039246C22
MIDSVRTLRRHRWPTVLCDLRRCTSGLALTEFALSLPILLALSLYGFETANLAIAHLRVSNIATLTADNAARIRDSIDEANIVELMTGAKMTGSGIDFAANGRIILTDFERTQNNSQWIRWQRCDGVLNVASSYGRPKNANNGDITNGTENLGADRMTPSTAPSSPNHATLTEIGPPGRQISASPGTAVMVVEVVYDYQPIVSERLFGPRQIRYESAFNVRQRNDHSLRNAGRVTPRSCNTFQP